MLGGKRQANILASVITNFETVEDVIQTSTHSAGSAMAENEKWLDSIEGKTYQFTNALETMWSNMLDSETVKWFLESATNIIKFLDTGVGKITALTLALSALNKFKFKGVDILFGMGNIDAEIGMFKGIKDWFTNRKAAKSTPTPAPAPTPTPAPAPVSSDNYDYEDEINNTTQQLDKMGQTAQEAGEKGQAGLGKIEKGAKDAGQEADKTNEKVGQVGETAEITGKKGQKGLGKLQTHAKSAGKAMAGMLKSMLIMYTITTVIDLIGDGIDYLTERQRENSNEAEVLHEKYTETAEDLEKVNSELKSLEGELETTNDKIEELEAQGTLSFVEQEELNRLKEVSAELERQITMTKTLKESLASGTTADAYLAGNAFLDTSFMSKESKTERQEKAEEEGKENGKLIGAAIGTGLATAGLIAAGFFTGGVTWAAVPGTLAAGLGGGALIGSAVGGYSASVEEGAKYDTEQTVREAIEDMDAARDALIAARDSTYEAYAADPGNSKLKEAYELAASDLADYDTTMANRMSQMQQYYNSIITNWEQANDDAKTAVRDHGDYLDAYNIAMGTPGAVEAAMSRVFGQEAEGTNVAAAYKELVRMVKDGKELDWTEAFNGDEAAAQAFIDRMYELGIYVFQMEDYFYDMAEAEKAAAEVEFKDVVTDLKEIVAAIKSLKSALEEFNEQGYTSAQTIADLSEALGIDTTDNQDLKDLFNDYSQKLLSGTANVAEAQKLTAQLAEEYIEGAINDGDLNQDTKHTYVAVLKQELNAANAEEVIEHKLQTMGLDKIKAEVNTFKPADGSEMDWTNTKHVQEFNKHIEDTVRLYGLEADAISDITQLLQKNAVENKNAKTEVEEQLSAYDNFLKGDASATEEFRKKGWNKLVGDRDYAQSKLDAYADLDDVNKWKREMVSFGKDEKTGKLLPKYVYKYKRSQGDLSDEVYAAITNGISEEDYNRMSDKVDEWMVILRASKDGLEALKEENSDYFDNSGELKKDIRTELEGEQAKIEEEIKSIDNTIETEFTIEYDLEFADKGTSNTLSALTAEIEKYTSSLSVLDEIQWDGQHLTEEQFATLQEQLKGVTNGTKDLFDAVDTADNYAIKNVDTLRDLVDASKRVTTQNIRMAKSQARLKYYELYKEITKLTKGEKVADAATRDYIDSLYDQMSVLEKTIAKYSILEAKLLGAANAYDKLPEAQSADEAMDYGSQAENLMQVLGEGFISGQLGTEAAQVAIEGLVPKEELEGLSTAEEKLAKIFEYATSGPLSQLFTIDFDDDGNISKVEMTEDNLKNFIDNNQGVFHGTWDNFTLDPAITSMEDFMAATNTTREIAFAFFTELERYDISWLNGKYDTIMDQLMGSDIEYQLNKKITELAEIEKRIANGTATKEDWTNRTKLQEEVDSFSRAAADQATLWLQTSNALTKNTEEQTKLNAELDAAIKAGDTEKVDDINSKLEHAREQADELYETMESLGEQPTEYTMTMGLEQVQEDLKGFDAYIQEWAKNQEKDSREISELRGSIAYIEDTGFENLGLKRDPNGKWKDLDVKINWYSDLDEDSKQEVAKYLDLAEKEYSLEVLLGSDTKSTEEVAVDALVSIETHLANITGILEKSYILNIGTKIDDSPVQSFVDWLGNTKLSKTITFGAKTTGNFWSGLFGGNSKAAEADGTAHVSGTAYAGGSWGTDKTEEALVGELGTELMVDSRTGTWKTIGANGAEFVNVPRGSIIFNHKQTKELLEHGHIASRGKAYAGGTTKTSGRAYAHAIGTNLVEDAQIKRTLRETVSQSLESVTDTTSALQTLIHGFKSTTETLKSDLSSALIDTFSNFGASFAEAFQNKGDGDGSGENEFEDVMDWVEVRLEELDEVLGKLNAELENAVDYQTKNNKIEEIIAKNRKKQSTLTAGAEEYKRYAQKFLDQTGAYRDMAQNGAIKVEDFAGDADKETLEAIQKYREYIQKAADLEQQKIELSAEIRDLYIQQIDNAQHSGQVKADVEASQTQKLQNAVDFDEARGLITDPQYYAAMMENSERTIAYLSSARKEMQEEFDQAVRDGQLIVGSDQWYEELNKLYEIDAQIDDANKELEEFQNAINDIYWDNLDHLINRFDYISEQAQGLIDIMSEMDMVNKPDNEKGWGANDVDWTAEGLATLGLHAQKMEWAEEKAKAYATAINDLNVEYAAGHYSESEYHDKLNELTQSQYDAIKAAQSEKKAIADLNKERVDAIKDGINKQIDAYSELIEKKKEELDAEKDLHDFAKSTAEKQKDIAAIQRKISALSNDNSASAIAQRKQLEAELAEARNDLEESYYDRSISNQQEALDKSLESYKENKEKEIETWEKYLDDIETVVKDSLGIVQEHADEIGGTLTQKTKEYNIQVVNAVLDPWKDGSGAIDEYTTKFGDATSVTTKQLETIRTKWESVKDEIAKANAEADKYYKAGSAGGPSVSQIHAKNADYTDARKTNTPTPSSNGSTSGNSNSSSQRSQYSTYVVKSGDSLWAIAQNTLGNGARWQEIYNLNKDVISNPEALQIGWKLKIPQYAKGTTSLGKSGIINIDELGEELVLGAKNGRLTYLEKGSGVIPADITSNLMSWGELNPQEMLDRNRPTIAPNKSVINTEISIDASVGTLLHVEHLDGNDPAEVLKIVDKAWDKKMQGLNNSLKRFTR